MVLLVFVFPPSANSWANVRSAEQVIKNQAKPTLRLKARKARIAPGERAILNWSARNARNCVAQGAWAGRRASKGVYRSPVLNKPGIYQFRMTCKNRAIRVQRSVAVTVAKASRAAAPVAKDNKPQVTLSAQPASVQPGQQTELRWNAKNAQWCNAEGGWTGKRSLTGKFAVKNLRDRKTFKIVCGKGKARATAMTTVDLEKPLKLSWQAPTKLTNGRQIKGLKGFKVYAGERSGRYSLRKQINNGRTRSTQLSLPRGDYFLVVTAITQSGVESGFSNEIFRKVR